MEISGKSLISILDDPVFQRLMKVAPGIKNLLATGAFQGLIGSNSGLILTLQLIPEKDLESLILAFQNCGYFTEIQRFRDRPEITNLRVYS